MTRFLLTARYVLIGALAVCLLSAGKPPAPVLRIRIALDQFIRESPGLLKAHPHWTGGLSFSHDGKKLAVQTSGHHHDANAFIHLALIGLDQPQPKVKSFDIYTGSFAPYPKRLQWSEDDRLLLRDSPLDSILIDTGSGTSVCRIKPRARDSLTTAGLLEDNRLFVVTGSLGPSSPDWRSIPTADILSVYDSQCAQEFERQLYKGTLGYSAHTGTRVDNRSASRGSIIVLVSAGLLPTFSTLTILRGPDWSVWRTIPNHQFAADPVFADNGRILCSGTPANGENGSVKCWSLNVSGTEPQQVFEIHKGGSVPISAASSGTRVAFMESSYSYNGFTENEKWQAKRYVVWDSTTGKTIAELPARRMIEDLALSPDGTLLALSGQDVVEVYSIGQ